MAVLLQLIGVTLKRPAFTLPALIILGVGAVTAIVAALTGTAQAVVARELPGIHEVLERHELLGNLAAWTLGVVTFLSIYLFLKGRWSDRLFLAVLMALAILLQVTGHFGGELVFRYGAGVNPIDPAHNTLPQ